MADPHNTDNTVMLTRNSKILVTVDEALHDVIVVSYALDSRLFQGVLIDSTKRYLPCRLNNEDAKETNPKNETSEEDKLYFSIRQRFTYFQEKAVQVTNLHLQKKLSTKSKSQKMTVRLRPRQVLCSKCKSICSENSENVNSHMTRSRRQEPPENTRLISENGRNNFPHSSPPNKLCPGFIPRVPRIQHDVNGVKEEAEGEEEEKQMVLRKKRSVGSMEDLWDETEFEESSKKAKTTPVIKISFGSQGEGTVLKIPSKVQLSESEADEKPTPQVRPSKKAMKKAKKEAKKKTMEKKDNESPNEESDVKKHKYKIKHKKKHKVDKDDDLKEQCLKQKLSINLKRVSNSAYEKADDDKLKESSESSSTCSEEIPNFPAVPPDANDTNGRVVEFCKTEDGTTFSVGDIVWGKLQGFPWWPGKVLNILIRTDKNSWDAHVSWFGSSTSSMMPCDQLSPFLQSFEIRYNKRKKSASYKEAIRLATTEASASKSDALVEIEGTAGP